MSVFAPRWSPRKTHRGDLRWADVHLSNVVLGEGLGEAGSVRLRRTVSVINGVRVESSTKGGRERVVSNDPATVAVLQAHRAAQNLERVLGAGSRLMGSEVVGGVRVFRQKLGTPLFPDIRPV